MPLYLVSTPIGNLDDLTARAKLVLANSDIILAENTRQTIKLLNYYQISGPKLTVYNDRNKGHKIPQVINWLNQGKKVSLVSNAGTPLISDPGYQLVKSAIKENIQLIPLPGPTALITGLIVSGFPPTRFSFLGFLPKSKNKKAKIFKELEQSKKLIPTIIFYESPKRLISTLKIILQEVGNLQIVVCREMTKKYEEFIRGEIDNVIKELNQKKEIKGEVTVILNLD